MQSSEGIAAIGERSERSRPVGQASRTQLVAQAVDAVEHGTSVEVAGPPGSGRTAFLHAVQARLEAQGWQVIAVTGLAALRGRPLSALAAAGALTADHTRSGDLRAAADQLAERLSSRRAAVVVDDRDDLDDGSWGALCTLRLARRTPLVSARTLGAPAASADEESWSAGGGDHDVATIELGGLRYDEFVTLLDARLEHPLDSSTIARIYAQTAGRPGLALAAVEAALRERRLIASGERVSGVGSLWSPSLARPLRALVEPLDGRQRDLLTLLALLGDTPIDTAESLSTGGADDVPGESLDALEERALVRIQETDGVQTVCVDPPLLADHLRGSTRPARRRRLLQQARDAATATLADAPPEPTDDAHFVQNLHAAESARVAEARRRWEATGTMDAAVACVRALLRGASAPDAEVDDVLARSAALSATDETRAAWVVEDACNRAYLHGEPAEAVDALRAAAGGLGRFGGLVLARAAEIETELVRTADPALLSDPDDADLPAAVRAATHRALGYVALVRGRLDDAALHLTAARAQGDSDDPLRDHLDSFLLLAQGDTGGSAEAARARFDSACAALDPVGMRIHGAVLTLGALADGRHSDADAWLAATAMLGGPSGAPPFAPSA